MPRPLPPTLGASLMGQPTLGVRRGKSSKKKRLITLSPSFFSPIEGHSLGHSRHVGRAERKGVQGPPYHPQDFHRWTFYENDI